MQLGIDVSEWNDYVDWEEVAKAGVQFVIPRLGYGQGHLDNKVMEHLSFAADYFPHLGVYYYSYALGIAGAKEEARMAYDLWNFVKEDSGIENYSLGFYLDMEDGDNYKAKNGIESKEQITAITAAFLNEMNRLTGEKTGLYASGYWLEEKIDRDLLPVGTPIWCAQWSDELPEDAKIWQFTDELPIGGQKFDGNYFL